MKTIEKYMGQENDLFIREMIRQAIKETKIEIIEEAHKLKEEGMEAFRRGDIEEMKRIDKALRSKKYMLEVLEQR